MHNYSTVPVISMFWWQVTVTGGLAGHCLRIGHMRPCWNSQLTQVVPSFLDFKLAAK
jgi:hypothetical protein